MLKRLTAACLLSFAGLGAAAQLPDSADMSAGGEFRRRTSRGAFVARTASQAHLQHGGLRGILKRKGRTRRSALCVFFPGPYRNDSPCAALRSRPAVTPSFTAAGIATPE